MKFFLESSTVLVLYPVSHLILLTTLRGRCYHLHFRDEKTGLEKLSHLPKVLQALLSPNTFPFDNLIPSHGCCHYHVWVDGSLTPPCLQLHNSWHMNVLMEFNMSKMQLFLS